MNSLGKDGVKKAWKVLERLPQTGPVTPPWVVPIQGLAFGISKLYQQTQCLSHVLNMHAGQSAVSNLASDTSQVTPQAKHTVRGQYEAQSDGSETNEQNAKQPCACAQSGEENACMMRASYSTDNSEGKLTCRYGIMNSALHSSERVQKQAP
eukprot:1151182-Pelagomonas_calceolata.AAC.8